MRSLIGSAAKFLNRNADASPVPYAAPGRYVIPALSGRSDNEVYMRTMGTAGTIFQIVSLLASSTAAAEWRLYRKPKTDGRQRYTTGDQGSDQRVEVLQHQALNVWNMPNPFSTGRKFREASQQHAELTGEQWWVVARDSRATFPTGMWLVRPDRMEPVPSAEKYIAGYVYTGPSGERVPLMPDEVILTAYPNPLDPYRGLGPVQSVLVDLDAMKYGSEWNRNFFINGAQPGGIVEVPSNLTDDEFDQFSTRWRESHQGVSRAHRVAILEGGAKWIGTQMSIKDMDFSNLRNVSRDVIREAWGIHKSMLGNSDEVNRSNAQTGEEVFGRWKILPRLDLLRDTLNHVFLPMFGSTGENVEFDYVNPLPDDREADNAELTAKTAAYAALVGANVDPDDAAEVVGLPKMRHVTQVPALPPAPAAGQLPPGSDSEGEPAEYDFSNRIRNAIAIRALSNAAAADHDPAAVDLSEMDAQHQQALDQLAAQYQQQITPDQQQQALDQIRQIVESGAIGSLGALVIDYAAAKALIRSAMVAYGHTAAQQAAREAKKQGVDITPVAPTSQQLDGIAEATASLMASELGTSAGREAARVAGGTNTPDADVVVTHVETFLQGLSDAGPKTHLGGALAAAANRARHGTFVNGPRCELIASEVRDGNTCVAPDTLVTTARGSVPAREVLLSDKLLTHAGRWVSPSAITVSEVEGQLHRVQVEDGRALRLTWDHPVLVKTGDGLAWRLASELAVGDLVLNQPAFEVVSKFGSDDLRLRNAPDNVAATDEIGRLADVRVSTERMPVGAVGFDDKVVTHEEVDGPRAYAHLAGVDDLKEFKDLPYSPLDARLDAAGDITESRTVLTLARLARDNSELTATVGTPDFDRWTSASFGAVAAPLLPAVPEEDAAALAGCVDPAGIAAALDRAVVVAAGVRDLDAELPVAVGADLCGLSLRRADLGPYFRIGELAPDGAVDGSSAVPASNFVAADFAHARRVVRVALAPAQLRPAAPTPGAKRYPDTTVDTELLHQAILPTITVRVCEIALEEYVGEVYDFTIPEDQTFWANGILVHNCGPCDEIDGHSFGYSDNPESVAEASAAYPTSGYILCEGGERCRGALIARYEAVAQPENSADRTVLSMLRRLVDLIEPQAPAPINGHDHHDREVTV